MDARSTKCDVYDKDILIFNCTGLNELINAQSCLYYWFYKYIFVIICRILCFNVTSLYTRLIYKKTPIDTSEYIKIVDSNVSTVVKLVTLTTNHSDGRGRSLTVVTPHGISKTKMKMKQKNYMYDNIIETSELGSNKLSSTLLNDSNHKYNGYFWKNLDYKYFEYKKKRYYWSEEAKTFIRFDGYSGLYTYMEVYELSRGHSEEDRINKQLIYGSNVMKVQVKSFFSLFFAGLSDPFYLIQILSIAIWIFDHYYYFAGTIFFILCVTLSINSYQLRKNLRDLNEMVFHEEKVDVLVDGTFTKSSSQDLVPGDVISIGSAGFCIPCDCVLISGNCVVNESMLTGESFPTVKAPLSFQDMNNEEKNKLYDTEKAAKSTLYCGTTVSQLRSYEGTRVLAVVINTSFTTFKGDMIHSVLYPKEIKFAFFRDSLKFLIILGCFALIGIIYSMYLMIRIGASVKLIFRKSLDVFTIVVPPGLPASLAIAIIYSVKRLKSNGISCIDNSRINLCGKLKMFCFDKTGTLTEDGISISGFLMNKSGDNSLEYLPVKDPYNLKNYIHLQRCMVTCHNLCYVEDVITGDPIDTVIFEYTNWNIYKTDSNSHYIENNKSNETYEMSHQKLYVNVFYPPENDLMHSETYEKTSNIFSLPKNSVAVLKIFQFESELQRMTVISKDITSNEVFVYSKGSPEIIKSLCNLNSIPSDFDSAYMTYAEQGYRILALCFKPLGSKIAWHKIMKTGRNEFESEMNFIGFLLFHNELKPKTKQVIHELSELKTRMCMVTGDNLLTAISIGCQCGIISPSHPIVEVKASLSAINRTCNEPSSNSDDVHAATAADWSNSEFLNVHEALNNKQNLDDMYADDNANLITYNTDKYDQETLFAPGQVVNTNENMNFKSSVLVLNENKVENVASKIEPNQNIIFPKNLIQETELDAAVLSHYKLEINIKEHQHETFFVEFDNDNKKYESITANHGLKQTIMDGVTFGIIRKHMDSEIYRKLLVSGVVFARMKPQQKAELVSDMQSLGYVVAMVGDGANDCSALKAAHAGIALAATEASVVSSFSTKEGCLTCIPKLLSEGRASLVTAFSMFKFIIMYSLIQFTSVIFLYQAKTILSDFEFLFIDLVLSTFLIFFMGNIASSKKLAKSRPLGRLVHPLVFFSLVGHFILQLLLHGVIFYMNRKQPWFTPSEFHNYDNLNFVSYDNAAIFLCLNFLYIASSLAVSIGPPHRMLFTSNKNYVFSLLIVFTICISILILPINSFRSLLQLEDLPSVAYRIYLLCITGIFFVSILLWEYLINNSSFVMSIIKKFRFKKQHRNLYKEIVDNTMSDKSWLSRDFTLTVKTKI